MKQINNLETILEWAQFGNPNGTRPRERRPQRSYFMILRKNMDKLSGNYDENLQCVNNWLKELDQANVMKKTSVHAYGWAFIWAFNLMYEKFNPKEIYLTNYAIVSRRCELDPQQQEQLWTCLKNYVFVCEKNKKSINSDIYMYNMVKLAMMCGQRACEIGDILVNKNFEVVSKKDGCYTLQINTFKRFTNDYIYVPSDVWEFFESNSTKYSTSNSLMTAFRTFLYKFKKYAGFEFQLTPQVLRRTFGCNLVRSGEHDLIVTKLMRHTCSTFRNNYATLIETCRKASLNACVSVIDGNDDNNTPSGVKLIN